MIASLVFALLITGISGIVAQTVLIRESLVIYGGNELSISLIIGSWVLWEALGAYAGGRWPRNGTNVRSALIGSIILFAVIFPASIYLVRIIKVAIGMPPEISMGITAVFYTSMTVVLPAGVLHGFSFTTSCRVYEDIKGSVGSAAGHVYFYEMLGTIAGGILVSYILITRLHSFRIAGIVSFFLALACVALALSLKIKNNRLLTGLCLIVAVFFLFFTWGGIGNLLQDRSIGTQWHGRNVVYYHNSPYQNIAVTKDAGQYTFFTDGRPTATIPVPDITRVEEFVHFPFLAHGTPGDILILHGGAGGVIGETLKYPTVKRVDYVEIDPAFLAAIISYPSELILSEMGDRRLSLHYTDGRRFVRTASSGYDVVLLGLDAPHTLQANRFFTMEFFREIKKILKRNGLFAFTVPGSLSYYSKELQDVNMSALATARNVFPSVAVIPGEANLFLASPSTGSFTLSAGQLKERMDRYSLKTRLISLPHLVYRLDQDRMEWFHKSIKGSSADANKDLTPKGLFYNIALNNALHMPSIKNIFAWAERTGPFAASVTAVLLIALTFLLKKRYRETSILFVISTTGFVVMLLELSLIFMFQVLYGCIFYEIGMLMTMLMAGMAAGSFAMARGRYAQLNASKTLLLTEGSIALFCFALLFLFSSANDLAARNELSVRFAFFALLFISGFLAGAEFPLAVKVYEEERPSSRSVGAVYGGDLLGGFAGGLLGGFFLFPMLGLTKSCLALAAVKVCGLLMLLSRRRK